LRLRLVVRVLALVSLIVSLFMLFPIAWSLADGGDDVWAFTASLVCGVMVSVVLFRLSGGGANYRELGVREALAVVVLSWVIAVAVGALPYVLTDVTQTYTDAFFETMSGFTTTGATIITDIEAAPRALLLWRALTHWVGGMGIIVLSLAVLPFLGVGGMELYRAEVPGPTPEKLTPRVQQTAFFLWIIYVLLTVTETILLMTGGMSFFDALTHSFSTIATGGFSTRNASIAYYESAYIEWVVTFFMFASGVNFSLHFLLLTGSPLKIGRDEEFRLYVVVVALSTLLIVAVLPAGGAGIGSVVRQAAFQVASLISTTGFVSANYDVWPHFARFLLLILMCVGGCAGSTSGGIKVVRILALARTIRLEAQSTLHPRAILNVRVNGALIPRQALSSMTAFFMLYVITLLAATLAVTAFGDERLDVLTAFSGVVASLSNVGPGLGHLGPVQNCAWLPDGVKWILSFCMLAGRLELYAVLLLFLPDTWKK
jgi:trk system potassium uptake protein TrkH